MVTRPDQGLLVMRTLRPRSQVVATVPSFKQIRLEKAEHFELSSPAWAAGFLPVLLGVMELLVKSIVWIVNERNDDNISTARRRQPP